MLAAIPYTTFPIIKLGPIELRTFGLMVGIGVLTGAFVAARHIETHTGVSRDDTYRLATRLVVAGVIGARLTWDITHWSQIGSPLDLIAVWKGGLQFSGGFIAAIIVGIPVFRQWRRRVRWQNLDGLSYGLCIGLAFGRVGCTSVGEHFGNLTNFFLAVRYDGGTVRENELGSVPLREGMVFHNTAIYELLFLLVLFGILALILRRKALAGTAIGVFCVYYGIARGLSDFLRVNDKTTFGLTGAQWMCVALIPAGLWILFKVRPTIAALADEEPPAADDTIGSDTETGTELAPEAQSETVD